MTDLEIISGLQMIGSWKETKQNPNELECINEAINIIGQRAATSIAASGVENGRGIPRLRSILYNMEGFILSCCDHCTDMDKADINAMYREVKEAKKIVG